MRGRTATLPTDLPLIATRPKGRGFWADGRQEVFYTKLNGESLDGLCFFVKIDDPWIEFCPTTGRIIGVVIRIKGAGSRIITVGLKFRFLD